ncbi:MAG: hypothetical protein B7X60_16740 [Polynucleobacter sp. 39-45-136]|jgi:hypothetical protein|nr:MAG: hypothetical protein B7X60_16740 [Polynucleobacter sp. 39-45-136]
MSMFKSMWGNRIFLLALTLLGSSVASAQDAVVSSSSVKTIAESLQYTSVFKNYQPYSEEEIIPWKQANATVQKIGGWKVYAKEAAQADAAQTSEGHSSNHHEGVK